MNLSINSISLKTPNLQEMRDFYAALGLELKVIKVDKGGELYRGQLGLVQFNLIPTSVATQRTVPSYQLAFESKDVAKQVEAIKGTGLGEIIMDLTTLPDRLMAIVIDPDGHAVELFQILS
jgi:lactoylglutathione lyase